MKAINTLCLIDDDHIFQFMTGKMIEHTNLVRQVMVFFNGLAAINFLKSVQNSPEKLPEVILLDLNMPVMDGWGFLEEYLLLQPKLGKAINIYIVSSSIDPTDIQKAKAVSAVSDYVIKPVTKQKFLHLLENL